jgi:HEAT repeat-containing protein 5
VRHELNEEAVALLTTALSALVDASQVFPSIIKTDLHACILHIFATILAAGSCQAIVVPQSLPILKRFVTSLATNGSSESSTQLRATLTRFLAILKHAQQREFEAALACEKNTILATTILISSTTVAFQPSDPLIKRFVDELFDCLGNRMTSKVAAGCCRSLLLLPKRGPVEMTIASQVLSHILSFLANPDDIEGLDETRTLLAQSLVAFVSTLLSPEQKQIAAKIIIPALLARANKEPKASGETAARLLELAGADQIAFRAVVNGLSPEQRAFMENVLKSSGVGAQKRVVQRDESEEPTIALKMDFGS